LIEELQRDALNSSVPVTQLLQKCLVVGSKLKIRTLVDWARLELDGYKDKQVPEYREVAGFPQVFNPVRGYQPLNFGNSDTAQRFSTMFFNQPVSELEHGIGQGGDGFHVSYTPEIEIALRKAVRPLQMTPSLLVPSYQFHRILEAVRKAVLEWALELESTGVKGEGMSFSAEEARKAQSATYNISNHIYGNVEHSQVGTAASTQRNVLHAEDKAKLDAIVRELKNAAETFVIEQQAKNELSAEIKTLEAQAGSPKPKIPVIKEALNTVRNILEGIAGNLAAAAILNQMNNFRF
jgi:hypothetical protein